LNGKILFSLARQKQRVLERRHLVDVPRRKRGDLSRFTQSICDDAKCPNFDVSDPAHGIVSEHSQEGGASAIGAFGARFTVFWIVSRVIGAGRAGAACRLIRHKYSYLIASGTSEPPDNMLYYNEQNLLKF
jgi:hypothetical protein